MSSLGDDRTLPEFGQSSIGTETTPRTDSKQNLRRQVTNELGDFLPMLIAISSTDQSTWFADLLTSDEHVSSMYENMTSDHTRSTGLAPSVVAYHAIEHFMMPYVFLSHEQNADFMSYKQSTKFLPVPSLAGARTLTYRSFLGEDSKRLIVLIANEGDKDEQILAYQHDPSLVPSLQFANVSDRYKNIVSDFSYPGEVAAVTLNARKSSPRARSFEEGEAFRVHEIPFASETTNDVDPRLLRLNIGFNQIYDEIAGAELATRLLALVQRGVVVNDGKTLQGALGTMMEFAKGNAAISKKGDTLYIDVADIDDTKTSVKLTLRILTNERNNERLVVLGVIREGRFTGFVNVSQPTDFINETALVRLTQDARGRVRARSYAEDIIFESEVARFAGAGFGLVEGSKVKLWELIAANTANLI